MLILSRTIGQRICVGDDVLVEVLEAQHGRTKLKFKLSEHLSMDADAKVGDRINLKKGITVEVTEARHGHVRLSFDAPKDVHIDREEVRKKIDAEGRRERGE